MDKTYTLFWAFPPRFTSDPLTNPINPAPSSQGGVPGQGQGISPPNELNGAYPPAAPGAGQAGMGVGPAGMNAFGGFGGVAGFDPRTGMLLQPGQQNNGPPQFPGMGMSAGPGGIGMGLNSMGPGGMPMNGMNNPAGGMNAYNGYGNGGAGMGMGSQPQTPITANGSQYPISPMSLSTNFGNASSFGGAGSLGRQSGQSMFDSGNGNISSNPHGIGPVDSPFLQQQQQQQIAAGMQNQPRFPPFRSATLALDKAVHTSPAPSSNFSNAGTTLNSATSGLTAVNSPHVQPSPSPFGKTPGHTDNDKPHTVGGIRELNRLRKEEGRRGMTVMEGGGMGGSVGLGMGTIGEEVNKALPGGRSNTTGDAGMGNDADEANGGSQPIDPSQVIIKHGSRSLKLDWVQNICSSISSSSRVSVNVELVSATEPEAFDGNGNGGWLSKEKREKRFMFKIQGTYARVLHAKSTLRKELEPEAKAEVSFPLSQIYTLPALFPNLNTSRGSNKNGLSPDSIIPEVRTKLNEIAMKTGVLLTIDDPVGRKSGKSNGSGNGSNIAFRSNGKKGSGSDGSRERRRGGDDDADDQGAFVMDSPESITVDLPNTGTSSTGLGSAGLIGSSRGSRRESVDAPHSGRSDRFMMDSPLPGIQFPPQPLDPMQILEEQMNQQFDQLGFLKDGTCAVVVQGQTESVANAKMLLLVLGDELNGLATESCEINEKLHRILAGRKNGIVNHIQAATETNIYFPEVRLVHDDSVVYGCLSPTMSPPLRFSPLASPIIAPGSAFNLALSTGASPFVPKSPTLNQNSPPTGLGLATMPGVTDPSAPMGMGGGLSSEVLASELANLGMTEASALSFSPGALSLSPTPSQSGWASPGSMSPGGGRTGKDTVYITGTSSMGVLNAKEWLLRLAYEKNTSVVPFQSPILPRKLDYLIHEKLPLVRRAMYDNGCTVKLLPGSQVGMVQVLGDHEISIRRCMKQVMKMMTETCLTAVWVTETMNVTSRFDTEAEARRLAIETDVEMAASSNCVEGFGGREGIKGIRRLYDLIEHPTNLGYQSYVQFQTQLLIEHQDFLGGKGMGKIVSMSRKSQAKIQLDIASDRLFSVNVRSDSIASVSIALGLLEDEMPAETSFYLPESHHRRIIGRNGKNIQEIMYANKVAVRFSSAEQWAEFGGHEDNEDNVLIITPTKNAGVIPRVKEIVMEHVPTDIRYYAPRTVLPIPRSLHAAIQADPAVANWQDKFTAVIRCLPRERGLDGIEVYSPKSRFPEVEKLLKSLLPLDRLILVKSSLHPQDIPDWPVLVRRVLEVTAITVKLSTTHKDGKYIPILLTTGIRDINRFEVAKGMIERFFTERQPVERSMFSPWGDGASSNSVAFGSSEPPVQYENNNFRNLMKNGKTSSLGPSAGAEWNERSAVSSPFESIAEDVKPKGLAHRLGSLRINPTTRTQSLDLHRLPNAVGAPGAGAGAIGASGTIGSGMNSSGGVSAMSPGMVGSGGSGSYPSPSAHHQHQLQYQQQSHSLSQSHQQYPHTLSRSQPQSQGRSPSSIVPAGRYEHTQTQNQVQSLHSHSHIPLSTSSSGFPGY